MRRVIALLVVCTLVLVGAPAAAAAAPISRAATAPTPLRVTMVELPTLGGETTWVTGLNDSGRAIGSSQKPDGSYHAVRWDHGEISELLPDWASSFAEAINNAGQILISGQHVVDGPTEYGLITKGRLVTIPDVSQALYLNERGQVAGMLVGSAQAFIWSRGVTTPISAPDGQRFAVTDFNDKGVVAGFVSTDGVDGVSAAVWRRGQLTAVDIPQPESVPFASVQLNNRGQVLMTNFFGGYLAGKKGTTTLGTPSGAPVPASDGYFLNNRGDVATSYLVDGDQQVFVWHRGTFSAITDQAGVQSFVADFDDCGRILGSTFVRTPGGNVRSGFLWWHGRLADLGADVGVSPTLGVSPRYLSRNGQILGSIMTITDPTSEAITITERPVLWTVQ